MYETQGFCNLKRRGHRNSGGGLGHTRRGTLPSGPTTIHFGIRGPPEFPTDKHPYVYLELAHRTTDTTIYPEEYIRSEPDLQDQVRTSETPGSRHVSDSDVVVTSMGGRGSEWKVVDPTRTSSSETSVRGRVGSVRRYNNLSFLILS